MIFTNNEIYNLAIKAECFHNDRSTHFPVKIGFYLFKNLKIFTEAARDIDDMKRNIVMQYGAKAKDDETYIIAPEDQAAVQKELSELGKLTQDIQLYPLKLKDFEDTKLSGEQLEILISMMEDPEEEEEIEEEE